MFQRLTDLFHFVEDLILEASEHRWFLALVLLIALLDSVFPVVPSELTVITGGVAAGAGTIFADQTLLALVVVIVLGATGAYLGDSLAYWIGARSERLLKRWFFRGDKGDARLLATSDQIRKRGGLLLVTARFIPGGRTAITFSCGLTHQPFWQWFTRWDLLATSLWATYAATLGYISADIIDNHATALWVAFGIALSVSLLIEIIRWLRERFLARSKASQS